MKTKKIPYTAIVAFKKKNLKLFVSIFQTFSRSGKLLDKFQDFFKNSRLCTKPVRKASALLATLSFRVRLGPCFAELYYGSVLRMLSLLLLVVTRLRRKLGQNSFPKSPIMHFDTRRRLDCFTKFYKPQTDKQPITTLKQTYKQRTKKHNNKWQLQYVY